MQKRILGNSGLEVGRLAFGGNVFGWTVDEEMSFKLLDGFVAAGFNLIDTADLYSRWAPGHEGGESETIIGNWVKQRGNRQDVIIATKVGMDMGPNKKGLGREHILRSADESLRRLQTDYIDLYQSHADDPETPLEETLEAFGELIKQGKVRAIGASNYAADRLAAALDVSRRLGLPRYESLQPLYNLCDRAGYEDEFQALCLREGVGVINYYALAAGFLTGKYRSEADFSKSARGDTVKKYLNERGLRIIAALDQVAERYQVTPAHIALAWLLTNPSVTAPIASATNLEQLNVLVEAMKLDLDQAAINQLNEASAENVASAQSN